MMTWLHIDSDHHSRSSHYRRRSLMTPGSRPGGAVFVLALCVAGLSVSRGIGASAARLPIMEEVYRPNGDAGGPESQIGGESGLIDASGGALGLGGPLDQPLFEYSEDSPSPIQPNSNTHQQLVQFFLRHPELLAQLVAMKQSAHRLSLMDEVLARFPAEVSASAAGVDATPAPPPKRGNYMALCHFKICNMGRKRRQDMQ